MDSTIMIALITGVSGLFTGIIASYFSYVQTRKIEELKSKLKQQNEIEEYILKQIFVYEEDMLKQKLLDLKLYLKIVQTLKDQTREIIKNLDYRFQEDLNNQVETLAQKIIQVYSEVRYSFQQSKKTDEYAHEIKQTFISLFNDLSKNEKDKNLFLKKIENISDIQQKLYSEMNKHMEDLLKRERNKTIM